MIGDKKKGFTLMETLVALALFMVVVTIASDLFLTFQRTSRKTENLEVVVSNARFIIERIAREVRDGTIDYGRYSDLSGQQDVGILYLRNSLGDQVAFTVENTVPPCESAESSPCFVLEASGSSESLTGNNVKVKNARFSIAPLEDPFVFNRTSGEYLSDRQPRVTIFVEVKNTLGEEHPDYVSYEVQTTISSRVYRR